MAIAYFIPDQAQLLARSSQQSAQQLAGGDSNRPANPAQQTRQDSQQQQGAQQRASSSHFRANLSVPLGREQGAMSMSEFGCWELLAQIFCYALRLYSYNPTQRRPTVIQISFEISSGSQELNTERAGDADMTDGSAKSE